MNMNNSPSFMQVNENSNSNSNFPRINGYDSRFKEASLDFVGRNQNSPSCIRREGMLKIRDVDQKDKDVVVTYAVLTKDRISYFVNAVFSIYNYRKTKVVFKVQSN